MGLLPSKESAMQLKFSHQHLPNPSIIVLNDKQYLKVVSNVEELEYERWNAVIKKYKQARQPIEYVLLPVSTSFGRTGICSSTGSVEIIYQKYYRLLSEELYHRSCRKTDFSQPEIWMILLYLLKAERQMQGLGQVLGDIRPENVFLDDEGRVRVGGRNSWPAGGTAFEKGVQKISAFVSPQDMEAIGSGAMQPSNPLPSDLFAIGLTLLSLANVVDYHCLYRMAERVLNLQALQEGVRELRRKICYSQILRCIIGNLCGVMPGCRLTLDELWSILVRHEGKIANKLPFIIDNAPQKLHKQVVQLRYYIAQNPIMFASPQLLSEVGGSGLIFPEHLNVHPITPEYVFEETKTIINTLPE